MLPIFTLILYASLFPIVFLFFWTTCLLKFESLLIHLYCLEEFYLFFLISWKFLLFIYYPYFLLSFRHNIFLPYTAKKSKFHIFFSFVNKNILCLPIFVFWWGEFSRNPQNVVIIAFFFFLIVYGNKAHSNCCWWLVSYYSSFSSSFFLSSAAFFLFIAFFIF